MTTIAYSIKHQRIASDSCVASEGNFIGWMKKIQKTDSNYLLGASGDASSVREFLSSSSPVSFETFNESFEGIIIHKDSPWLITNIIKAGMCQIDISELGVYTLGSGGEYAMGALLAGKSPEEAVEIASRVDIGATRGKIWIERF